MGDPPWSLALPQSVLPHPSTAPALNCGNPWGQAGIASPFATSLKELTKSKLAAIGSRTLARSEDFARTYGDDGTRAYGSYAQVLERPGSRCCLYCGPAQRACGYSALQAIAAGKHVLGVEKPLGLNAQAECPDRPGCQSRWRVCHGSHVLAPAAHRQWWFSQVIASGMLGQVITVQADFGAKFPVHYEYADLRPGAGRRGLAGCGHLPHRLQRHGLPRHSSCMPLGAWRKPVLMRPSPRSLPMKTVLRPPCSAASKRNRRRAHGLPEPREPWNCSVRFAADQVWSCEVPRGIS